MSQLVDIEDRKQHGNWEIDIGFTEFPNNSSLISLNAHY